MQARLFMRAKCKVIMGLEQTQTDRTNYLQLMNNFSVRPHQINYMLDTEKKTKKKKKDK